MSTFSTFKRPELRNCFPLYLPIIDVLTFCTLIIRFITFCPSITKYLHFAPISGLERYIECVPSGAEGGSRGPCRAPLRVCDPLHAREVGAPASPALQKIRGGGRSTLSLARRSAFHVSRVLISRLFRPVQRWFGIYIGHQLIRI